MYRSYGKRIVSSEATEEEILHIRRGTLDQVESIALLRAFDPGAWVRIAFDVTVASNLRGEPFVKSVLQSGQTSQLMLARTFADLNNCLVSTAMEYICDFLRGNFPSWCATRLSFGSPSAWLSPPWTLFALGAGLSLRHCGWRPNGISGGTNSATSASMYHCPDFGAHT